MQGKTQNRAAGTTSVIDLCRSRAITSSSRAWWWTPPRYHPTRNRGDIVRSTDRNHTETVTQQPNSHQRFDT
jgi:hypothetical protein